MVDSKLYDGNLDRFFVGDKIPAKYFTAFRNSPENDFTAILNEVRKEGYYDNWKDEKHLGMIRSLYPSYLSSKGMTIVTLDEYNLAKECIAAIESDPIWLSKGKGEYQKALFGKVETMNGVIEIKGLLDELHHEYDYVIKDLKVTDCRLIDWQKLVAKKLMYPFQGAFYRELVKQNYGGDPTFEWLVYSTVDKKIARFICSEDDLIVGEWGNSYVSGWRYALEIYAECKDKGDYFTDFIRGNGVIKTNIYG